MAIANDPQALTENPGRAASQARVAAEVCDEPLSQIRWMRRCEGGG